MPCSAWSSSLGSSDNSSKNMETRCWKDGFVESDLSAGVCRGLGMSSPRAGTLPLHVGSERGSSEIGVQRAALASMLALDPRSRSRIACSCTGRSPHRRRPPSRRAPLGPALRMRRNTWAPPTRKWEPRTGQAETGGFRRSRTGALSRILRRRSRSLTSPWQLMPSKVEELLDQRRCDLLPESGFNLPEPAIGRSLNPEALDCVGIGAGAKIVVRSHTGRAFFSCFLGKFYVNVCSLQGKRPRLSRGFCARLVGFCC